MKNRTLIGILCIVLAVALTFIVSPLVSKFSTNNTEVPRLSADVRRGAEISEADIEMVKVKGDTLPAGVITDKKQIIGQYASSMLYSGDYITKEKITDKANSAEDAIAALDGTKYAMSFTVDNFASGVSGKLQNGDIISLVVKSTNGTAVMPASFKYVKVITTTTAGGIDQDKLVKNDDGSFDVPATVTVLVNAAQATQLADYEDGAISCVLVYRGTAENAKKFLDKQDEYFNTAASGNCADMGNAEYYDVNEAVNGNG